MKPGDLAVKLADGVVALNGAKAMIEAPVRGRVGIEGKDVAQLLAAAAGRARRSPGRSAATSRSAERWAHRGSRATWSWRA